MFNLIMLKIVFQEPKMKHKFNTLIYIYIHTMISKNEETNTSFILDYFTFYIIIFYLVLSYFIFSELKLKYIINKLKRKVIFIPKNVLGLKKQNY